VKNRVNQTVIRDRTPMVMTEDVAWLAGIVDGEGCFSVKRPMPRNSAIHGRTMTSWQLWLVVCNTSRSMIERAQRVLTELGVHTQPIRRVWKGKKATRWQYWLHVARKDDLRRATAALLPHLTAKRVEAAVVLWFLTRACQKRAYHPTALDGAVLGTMAFIKRNGGEAPAEVVELLREVIPSEAALGADGSSAGGAERVETRAVTPKDNRPQERPAPLN
jgi:hypothetical protein